MNDIKQVIIIRKDLKMRRGKEIAQGAHASMKWLLENLNCDFNEDELTWINGIHKKVVLSVDSLEELEEIVKNAKKLRIENAYTITDLGLTEFNGIPTITCAAIGPAKSELINQVTGHLKPY